MGEIWGWGAFLTPSSHQAVDTNDDKLCEEYFVKQTDVLDLVYLTQISGITGKTHASVQIPTQYPPSLEIVETLIKASKMPK